MEIKIKLICLFLIIGILPLIVVVAINYQNTKEGVQVHLDTSKKIIDQAIAMSQNRMILEATQSFKQSFFEYGAHMKDKQKTNIDKRRAGLSDYYNNEFLNTYRSKNSENETDTSKIIAELDDNALLLQSSYISENLYPLGSKDNLNSLKDGSSYSFHHSIYHPIIKDFLKRFNYYDIFIVDSESGDVMYSVFKEIDFATSLKNGSFADSGLGRCFAEANRLSQ